MRRETLENQKAGKEMSKLDDLERMERSSLTPLCISWTAFIESAEWIAEKAAAELAELEEKARQWDEINKSLIQTAPILKKQWDEIVKERNNLKARVEKAEAQISEIIDVLDQCNPFEEIS